MIEFYICLFFTGLFVAVSVRHTVMSLKVGEEIVSKGHSIWLVIAMWAVMCVEYSNVILYILKLSKMYMELF